MTQPEPPDPQAMKCWYVFTPLFEGRSGPYDPPEPTGDVVLVEASSRREALVKGLRELRRTKSRWVAEQTANGRSPFAGLKAESAERLAHVVAQERAYQDGDCHDPV